MRRSRNVGVCLVAPESPAEWAGSVLLQPGVASRAPETRAAWRGGEAGASARQVGPSRAVPAAGEDAWFLCGRGGGEETGSREAT